ncbi:MAG: nucleotidyltransferase family protein [Immundisolibacteraceae bacterium]|nr:nucleotidyltransferase family protein [Immundisolibacteraceae bacterium]
MIRGILLAAGRGTRFGTDKLMQPIQMDTDPNEVSPTPRSIGLVSASTLISSLPNSIAVCRPEQSLLREQLTELGFDVKTSDQADQGMGFSLATAVAACEPTDNMLICLADMPYVKAITLEKIAMLLGSGAALVQPLYQQKPGNPVGISHRFRQLLLEPGGDFGARKLLKQHAEEVSYLEVDDPGVVMDIDRPEDLNQL